MSSITSSQALSMTPSISDEMRAAGLEAMEIGKLLVELTMREGSDFAIAVHQTIKRVGLANAIIHHNLSVRVPNGSSEHNQFWRDRGAFVITRPDEEAKR